MKTTATKTRTEWILLGLQIASWLIFIGFMIEAGAILFSYVMTLFNPEAARSFYNGLDLYDLRQEKFGQYTNLASLMVFTPALKAFVAYLTIKALSKVNLVNPFTLDGVRLLEKISYALLGLWAFTLMSHQYMVWLSRTAGTPAGNGGSGEALLMAGLVFVISQIFKRGVEVQSENELTV